LKAVDVVWTELVVKTQPYIMDGQRRDRERQYLSLKGWKLNRNRGSVGRSRYWNRLSEDLILGGQEETKVKSKVHKRLYKESKEKKGNRSREKQIVPLNTPNIKTAWIQL
jgi:hypothetical protein